MITNVAAAVQLLKTHQGHVVRGPMLDSILGCRAEIHPVEAAAADIWNGLVAVSFGVPCVAAVLLLAQSLPDITDTGGQAHLGHLKQSQTMYW